MNKIWVSAFGFFIFTAVAWAAPVPDTGQTKCYNNTVEIPCPSPGQPFYGQDANFSINPMSYTKLDSSGNSLSDSAAYWHMVKDNVTGLIWESKTNDGTTNDKDNTYTWYDPADLFPGSPGDGTDTKAFIDALNGAKFGGYSDWRIPTVKELGTITNFNISGPEPTSDTDYFPDTQASFYWSATTDAYITDNAWGINFDKGYDGYNYKSRFYFVRAVRGGEKVGGYMDNGNGTVTDTFRGLMWQQQGPSSTQTWEDAISYCGTLNLGGHTDWRLPTKKEMRSLVDFSRYAPSIDTNIFPEVFLYFYWSSTTNANITDHAWGVNFYDGYDGYGNKSDDYFVRAVRGGQAKTPAVCTATIDKNFMFHLPYLSYVSPLLGTIFLWADFVYEFNATYPALTLFKLITAGSIYNPTSLCSTSTLSSDFKIHIPDVLFSDGNPHLWVDLEYSSALSSHDNVFFVVTSYGVVSN